MGHCVVGHPFSNLVSVRAMLPVFLFSTKVFYDGQSIGFGSVILSAFVSKVNVIVAVMVKPRCLRKCFEHRGVKIFSEMNQTHVVIVMRMVLKTIFFVLFCVLCMILVKLIKSFL